MMDAIVATNCVVPSNGHPLQVAEITLFPDELVVRTERQVLDDVGPERRLERKQGIGVGRVDFVTDNGAGVNVHSIGLVCAIPPSLRSST
jgi:hypothetical protein